MILRGAFPLCLTTVAASRSLLGGSSQILLWHGHNAPWVLGLAEGRRAANTSLLNATFSLLPLSAVPSRTYTGPWPPHHAIGGPGICTHVWHATECLILPWIQLNSLSWWLSVGHVWYWLHHSWSSWTFAFASFHNWCHSIFHPWPL